MNASNNINITTAAIHDSAVWLFGPGSSLVSLTVEHAPEIASRIVRDLVDHDAEIRLSAFEADNFGAATLAWIRGPYGQRFRREAADEFNIEEINLSRKEWKVLHQLSKSLGHWWTQTFHEPEHCSGFTTLEVAAICIAVCPDRTRWGIVPALDKNRTWRHTTCTGNTDIKLSFWGPAPQIKIKRKIGGSGTIVIDGSGKSLSAQLKLSERLSADDCEAVFSWVERAREVIGLTGDGLTGDVGVAYLAGRRMADARVEDVHETERSHMSVARRRELVWTELKRDFPALLAGPHYTRGF